MVASDKIENCVFCGRTARLFEFADCSRAFVGCSDEVCGCCGPTKDSPQKAIRVWNRFCIAAIGGMQIAKDADAEAAALTGIALRVRGDLDAQ